jgi:hypothetical protein
MTTHFLGPCSGEIRWLTTHIESLGHWQALPRKSFARRGLSTWPCFSSQVVSESQARYESRLVTDEFEPVTTYPRSVKRFAPTRPTA